MKSLDDIQIFEMTSIVNEVINSSDLGNPLYREADQLIQGNTQVEQCQWDQR